MATDLYTLLGVERSATAEEIKAAFKVAAMKAHPDRGGSVEDMQAVNAAYEVLGNPESRRHYDKTGEAPESKERLADIAREGLSTMFARIAEEQGWGSHRYVRQMRWEIRRNTEVLETSIKNNEVLLKRMKNMKTPDAGEDDVIFAKAKQVKIDRVTLANTMMKKDLALNSVSMEILNGCKDVEFDPWEDTPLLAGGAVTKTFFISSGA